MHIGNTASSDLVRGNLENTLLVEILGNVYARRLTGRLDLISGSVTKEVYFMKGLPIFVTSTTEDEDLLDIIAQIKKMPQIELLQLKTLKKEKRLESIDLLKQLGLYTDPELYAFRVERFTQIIIDACSWKEGRFRFNDGKSMIKNVPIYDLNPLEMIYQGIKSHLSLDLDKVLQQVQNKKARLTHGWEEKMALPQIYYEHSHVLDLFEREITIADSFPGLFKELGEINEVMRFLYLLLVTGLLELVEPGPEQPKPAVETEKEKPPTETEPPPAESHGSFYISTSRKREKVGAISEKLLGKSIEVPAPETGHESSADSIEYIDIDSEAFVRKSPQPLHEPDPKPAPASQIEEAPPPLDFEPELKEPERPPEPEIREEPPIIDLDDPVTKDLRPLEESAPKKEIPEAPLETRAPKPPPSDEDQKAAELIKEVRERLEQYESKFERALDYFELMGIDVETEPADLQKAHDQIMDDLSLDQLPRDSRDKLRSRQESLIDKLDKAYFTLTDYDERMEHEQKIFNKRIQRANSPSLKEKLGIVQWNRGQWYLQFANRPDLARSCFHQALELDQNKPQYYAYVGWACYLDDGDKGDMFEIYDYLNHAIRINPDYAQAHYFLGVIAKRNGDKKGAQEHFEKVMAVDPDHPQARREHFLYKSQQKQAGILGRIFGKGKS